MGKGVYGVINPVISAQSYLPILAYQPMSLQDSAGSSWDKTHQGMPYKITNENPVSSPQNSYFFLGHCLLKHSSTSQPWVCLVPSVGWTQLSLGHVWCHLLVEHSSALDMFRAICWLNTSQPWACLVPSVGWTHPSPGHVWWHLLVEHSSALGMFDAIYRLNTAQPWACLVPSVGWTQLSLRHVWWYL